MELIPESVSEREAEALWLPDPIYGLDYDRTGRIKAYVRGRTAKPCDEQIEAVARILFEESWTHRPAPISFDEFKAMSKDKYTDERIEGFRRRARMLLNAARKAVM